ncbi:MAG TPA: FtsX-like permease family protein [Puia sp.]|nr:FtsX-like permease family protein [Puia sp.]
MKLLFAWRYFRAKKSTNAINIIAWVSMTAIVVGTASLVLVLSVFNGFEDLVKSLYVSFYPDLKILPSTGKTMVLSPDQLLQLSGVSGIHSVSLVAEDEVVMQNGESQTLVILKGVDSNYRRVTGVAEKTGRGTFDLGTDERPLSVLGAGIENSLNIEADRALAPLAVYFFRKGAPYYSADPLSSINNASLATSGAFRIQQDFDNHYAFTNLPFVRRMMGLQTDEYSAAELSVDDPEKALLLKQQLERMLGHRYGVQTRYEQNQSLYTVMRTEKWVIYIILTLILVVAAFNMVGALTMLVWEKQKDIQVLKALGASGGLIQKIFLSEGVLLAMMGGVGGIGIASVICWLQLRYRLVPLAGGSFLIDYYPVKLVASDFAMVLSTILVVALLAAWLPARKAAQQAVELKS